VSGCRATAIVDLVEVWDHERGENVFWFIARNETAKNVALLLNDKLKPGHPHLIHPNKEKYLNALGIDVEVYVVKPLRASAVYHAQLQGQGGYKEVMAERKLRQAYAKLREKQPRARIEA
jgi:hypothetical protein